MLECKIPLGPGRILSGRQAPRLGVVSHGDAVGSNYYKSGATHPYGPYGNYSLCCLRSNGALLASGSYRTVTLWDVATGQVVRHVVDGSFVLQTQRSRHDASLASGTCHVKI